MKTKVLGTVNVDSLNPILRSKIIWINQVTDIQKEAHGEEKRW